MPDIEGLHEFSLLKDRGVTPFFSGRTEILDHVKSLAFKAFTDITSPPRNFDPENISSLKNIYDSSGTVKLLIGAPGAGKTSILHWMEYLYPCGQQPYGAIKAVRAQVSDLANTEKLVLRLADAFTEGGAKEFRESEMSSASGTIGILSGRTQRATAAPDINLSRLAWMYSRRKPNHPVILMVDEIQTVTEDCTRTLLTLHDGCEKLPVIPVFAGLGDSEDVLNACGLSRLMSTGGVENIGMLHPNEAKRSVARMLEMYGIDCGNTPHDWPGILADISDLWPQHLHNAMRALAVELVRAQGDLAAVSRETVLLRQRNLRNDAYRRRISNEMDGSICLTAAVMAALPEDGSGLRLARLNSAVARAAEKAEDGTYDPWRLPDGMELNGFVRHLVHRGALHKRADRTYDCPIPSFRMFLIQEGHRMDPDAIPAPLALPAPPHMLSHAPPEEEQRTIPVSVRPEDSDGTDESLDP